VRNKKVVFRVTFSRILM